MQSISTNWKRGRSVCILLYNCLFAEKSIGVQSIYVFWWFKGKDDLRQDAVMEQVFSVANMLLQQNTETRKKKLKMRTYKVYFILVFGYFLMLS